MEGGEAALPLLQAAVAAGNAGVFLRVLHEALSKHPSQFKALREDVLQVHLAFAVAGLSVAWIGDGHPTCTSHPLAFEQAVAGTQDGVFILDCLEVRAIERADSSTSPLALPLSH